MFSRRAAAPFRLAEFDHEIAFELFRAARAKQPFQHVIHPMVLQILVFLDRLFKAHMVLVRFVRPFRCCANGASRSGSNRSFHCARIATDFFVFSRIGDSDFRMAMSAKLRIVHDMDGSRTTH